MWRATLPYICVGQDYVAGQPNSAAIPAEGRNFRHIRSADHRFWDVLMEALRALFIKQCLGHWEYVGSGRFADIASYFATQPLSDTARSEPALHPKSHRALPRVAANF